VIRSPKTHVEVHERSTVTPVGGLVLVAEFLRRFGVARCIDEHVDVFQVHRPYYESDHVLAQALNLYAGGTCLEDQAALQHDEGVLRLLGAVRIPDPTTAGDFLRRFDPAVNPGSLEGLRAANDQIQSSVWSQLAGKRRRKREWAIVDLDGHTKVLYGEQKEGADFDYRGRWSYSALMASLAGTGECLGVRLRGGNVRSSEGAAALLDEILPRLKASFRRVLVRADSDFDRRDVREMCEAHGVSFAFVGRAIPGRSDHGDALAGAAWRPFDPRALRQQLEREAAPGFRARRRGRSRRRAQAQERGYWALQLQGQHVAEVPWKDSRLVLRRQRIAESVGQWALFDTYRYRYVVTNLPSSWSADDVIDATYQRCDQENVIEQLGSGIAAWRMPVGELAGNAAWLEIARLAWNLGKWIAELVLPPEVVRWKWKRFRRAFVYVAAEVVRHGRQVRLRFSPSHRWVNSLVHAHVQLQT
jgi:hypothetical protein